MSRKEVLYTRYGEMLDLISCYQVEKGERMPKKKKKIYTFDEAIALE